MAAEDSEKLARRLQAEEDSIAEILFHGVADNAIGRQLSTENELEDKSKHARPTKNQDHDNIPIPTPTHNNHILSDEALARLLQAEEDQRARDSVQTEASCSHSSSTLPPMSHVDSDEALARRLQAHDQQDTPNDRPNEDISNDLELFSPTPDVHALFRAFDLQYFDGMLRMVELKWSKRMTLCAGICSYRPLAGLCSIRLSEPLLKFRSREDLIDTLLHEMIHALLFVTQNNIDHDGHGPQFLMHASRINKSAGTKITVYHNFRDEVDYHRTHVWKCNGPCQYQPPFYGIVRRSMNRPPQKADTWWGRHQLKCGGTYTKISEPEKKNTMPKKKQREKERDGNQLGIEGFLKRSESSSSSSDKEKAAAKRRNLGRSE